MIGKKITYSLFLVLFFFFGFSQNPKVEQARAHYISQKISLSPSESQKFWPVYNEYLDKLKTLRKERRKLYHEYHFSSDPSVSEQFIQRIIQSENAEASLRTEYIRKFQQILGGVKTADLLKAEEDFRLELVKILKSEKSD